MSEFKLTDKNPRFFYDTSQFSFLKPLTDNFSVIKNELVQLIESNKENQWFKTFPHYVTSDNQKAWKVFSFIFFMIKYTTHAKLCPKTAELVYSIPEIMSCDFSFMKPNTHIRPHRGFTHLVLRCHLPLLVPHPELCAIRVGTETVHWKEGELIIFDDSFEHEAFNNSNKDRVVLMFDIPNPLWGCSPFEISKQKIYTMEDAFMLSVASKEKWIEAFEAGQSNVEVFGE